ncbi:MAG: amidohydrolase family protein [Candidatus Riflebacteria bacterium]|nr:amidohydrolase family protein [Candidatus Riflebacteria bacterium]
MGPTLYRARWVLPIDGPPIADGAVGVDGTDLVWVGPASKGRRHRRWPRIVDLEDAVLTPGLVNAHSHLELTAFRGLLEDLPFTRWLRELVRLKYQVLTPGDFVDAATWGCLEALRAGVTTVGDTGDSGATVAALSRTGLRGVFYQEVFGPDRAEADGAVVRLARKVRALASRASPTIRVGVSPHAVYTVSDRLFQLVQRYAARDGLDVAIHISESRDEVELIRDGTGELARTQVARGLPCPPRGTTPIRHLEDLGALHGGPLLIHAVQATDEELDLIALRGARVAHCPRSNAKLGHGSAPLAGLLSRGVAVGLGSDSVASNNSMDLIGEAREAALVARSRERRADAVPAPTAVDLATRGGARALRWDREIGSLRAGMRADLSAFSMTGAHWSPAAPPEVGLVFSGSGLDAVLTVVAGEELHVKGSFPRFSEEEVAALRKRISKLSERLARARRTQIHA